MFENLYSVTLYIPEVVLAIAVLLVLILDLLLKDSQKIFLPLFSLLALAAALFYTLQLYHVESQLIFSGMISVDPFSLFFKIFFLVSTGVIFFHSIVRFRKSGEFYSLALAATLGMCVLSSAADILTLILGLELLSIPSYILAGYYKDSARSSEASLKYILYGAFSTGMMIYGYSLIYGMTGETNIHEIHTVLAGQTVNSLTMFLAMLMILAGIGFKIAFVPFHFWCPDVYEGAPTTVAAFFSVGPKAAGIAALIRVLFIIWASPETSDLSSWIPAENMLWPMLIAVLSAVTMTLGNFAALQQNNLKRLMAYSTIAHAGYILMGLVLLTGNGLKAALFYLVAYLFMNLGAFLIIDAVTGYIKSEDIDGFRGLGKRAPFIAVALAYFLFSLTGIPVTAGFIGKFYLFWALIANGWYWLAIIGVLNAAVSLYYYARIMKVMFLSDAPADLPSIRISPIYVSVTILMIIPTFVFGIYWSPLLDLADMSIQYFLP